MRGEKKYKGEILKKEKNIAIVIQQLVRTTLFKLIIAK